MVLLVVVEIGHGALGNVPEQDSAQLEEFPTPSVWQQKSWNQTVLPHRPLSVRALWL